MLDTLTRFCWMRQEIRDSDKMFIDGHDVKHTFKKSFLKFHNSGWNIWPDYRGSSFFFFETLRQKLFYAVACFDINFGTFFFRLFRFPRIRFHLRRINQSRGGGGG